MRRKREFAFVDFLLCARNYSRCFTCVFQFYSHSKQFSGKESLGVCDGSNESDYSSFRVSNQL